MRKLATLLAIAAVATALTTEPYISSRTTVSATGFTEEYKCRYASAAGAGDGKCCNISPSSSARPGFEIADSEKSAHLPHQPTVDELFAGSLSSNSYNGDQGSLSEYMSC
jgi:hypothetical protein